MRNMLRTFFVLGTAICIFGIFSFCYPAYSESQEYKDYTVKKGDTLWDISSKEMTDPFLWPKVWKENSAIKNPDLIYPGQRIKIPLSVLPKEITPRPAAQEAIPVPAEPQPEKKAAAPLVVKKPAEKRYLVDKNLYVSSGYIVPAFSAKGQVIIGPSERITYGKDDYLYLKTAGPVKTGDRFYVTRPPRLIEHPVSRENVGYLVEIIGVVEVRGDEMGRTKAKLITSYFDVDPGCPLIDYYEMEPPLVIENPRTPDINGYIVGSKQGLISLFVYLDKGKNDGIEAGDLVGIVSQPPYDSPIGYLQVIRVQDTTSTAMIRKYQREVMTGDSVVKLLPPIR